MKRTITRAAEHTGESAFDVLAHEYYDPELHPTCSNFRKASNLLLTQWIVDGQGDLCDVGCGKSVLAEIVSYHSWSPSSLLLVDSSAAMLEHSRQWEEFGATLILASADELPIGDSSIDLLVASLGDPYNEERFWGEAYRVLRKNGLVAYTTPSAEWASAFRGGLERYESSRADFVLADGKRTWIPSRIYSESVQLKMIESSGLSVEDIKDMPIHKLSGDKLSPKLAVLDSGSSPVVSGYLARKQ